MRTQKLVLCLMALTAFACSDDDGDEPDASMGAGPSTGEDAAAPPMRPRFDGGTVVTDAIPPCEVFRPNSCGAGQKCEVLVRRSATEQGYTVATGCVADSGGRAEGEPCQAWNAFNTPYEVDGLFDEVHLDPCDEGLVCAADPDIRGLSTCQRSCQSGLFAQAGFPPIACEGANEYCEASNFDVQAPFLDICKEADACDPLDERACPGDLLCTVRLVSGGLFILSECTEPAGPEPTAVGEACNLINECGEGAICWGPGRLTPDQWAATNVLCRQVCSPDGDADAGGCPDGTECVPLADSGLDFGLVPGQVGQCE